ncbi:MAG TPA: polyhydroxyalkanoate synthesis regulator DNA-binding domain-containing protein [Planctomycetota bacterium]|nr:polyhydroxyalkanoate synthesis regulator DNA-binding domain-containing protein [Planctomycetota bacterium]
MRTTIKRYSNRKLYDVARKRYVGLEELARRIAGGEEVQVVDHRTRQDLTTVTLAQILLEREKRRRSTLTKAFFMNALRQGARRAP